MTHHQNSFGSPTVEEGGNIEPTVHLAPNMWLYSSVDRASHRHHRGHVLKSPCSPKCFFFQVSFSNRAQIDNSTVKVVSLLIRLCCAVHRDDRMIISYILPSQHSELKTTHLAMNIKNSTFFLQAVYVLKVN